MSSSSTWPSLDPILPFLRTLSRSQLTASPSRELFAFATRAVAEEKKTLEENRERAAREMLERHHASLFPARPQRRRSRSKDEETSNSHVYEISSVYRTTVASGQRPTVNNGTTQRSTTRRRHQTRRHDHRHCFACFVNIAAILFSFSALRPRLSDHFSLSLVRA